MGIILVAAPVQTQELASNTGFNPQELLRNALQWVDNLGEIALLKKISKYLSCMSTKKEQLRELVEKGLMTEIAKMEKNYFLITTITSKGSDIDAPGAGNFGDLFRVFQKACLTETILATFRLYEKQNKRNPNLCK